MRLEEDCTKICSDTITKCHDGKVYRREKIYSFIVINFQETSLLRSNALCPPTQVIHWRNTFPGHVRRQKQQMHTLKSAQRASTWLQTHRGDANSQTTLTSKLLPAGPQSPLPMPSKHSLQLHIIKEGGMPLEVKFLH